MIALRVGVPIFIVYRTLHEQELPTSLPCPTCSSSSTGRSISEDCFLSMAWPDDPEMLVRTQAPLTRKTHITGD
jgi:hypothetical protein